MSQSNGPALESECFLSSQGAEGGAGHSRCVRLDILKDVHTRHTSHEDFGRIVTPRMARLRRLALKILRSEDLADDAVQEALLSLWREERMPPNVDGWLVRAVVNRSLHMNRTRQRRRKHEERASCTCLECDPGEDAASPLEREERVRAVTSALAGLPDHLRTVLTLREVDRMDYESIAETIRVPVGTVRSRLFRAREALKDALLESPSIR